MNSTKIFVKREVVGEFGQFPEQRPVAELINNGIVNIDKPKGPTSHQVSDYVQKILQINKAGHSGTLDPQVTGVQPVALGQATRITLFLLTAPKEYVGIMHLHKEVDEKFLFQTVQKFIGKIKQMPPIKSAVKRQMRIREIYEFELIEIKGNDVLFRVKCQAGTYIRKLCLHPQTNILTSEGPIIAEEFYSGPKMIYSYHHGRIIQTTSSATQKISSPQKLIKITMSSGVNFIVTPDHELFTSKEEGYGMREAEVLREGDYLVKSLIFPDASKEYVVADLLDKKYLVQQNEIKELCKQEFISKYGSIRAMSRRLKLDRKVFLSKTNSAITIQHLMLAGIYEKIKQRLHTFKTQKGSLIKMREISPDLCYLLGLIASDGNNTKEKGTARYTRVKFHNNEEKVINVFLELHRKLFPNILITKKKITAKLWELDTANSFLATIAASLGIKSPQKGSSLRPILSLKPSLIKYFLKGYFDGDGSVYCKKTAKNDKSKICLHTISCKDAFFLHQMLLKVGVHNKIFPRRKFSSFTNGECILYDVTVGTIPSEKKFIVEIGTNHPKKAQKFKEVMNIKYNANVNDHLPIAFHYKEEIRKNKTKLHKMGGNLSRILKDNTPLTRGFYTKASKIVTLPNLDEFTIEKITKIELVEGTNFVYDLTVPKTHNFLIETGFVSSNCHDLGQALKVGAHMAELRRTQAGPFTEQDQLVTLNDLQDAFYYYQEEKNDKFLRHCLQPVETALKYLPKCWIFDTTIASVTNGRAIGVPGISKLEQFTPGEAVAVLTLKGELVAVGEALMTTEEIMAQPKGLAIKIHTVFMRPKES